MYDRSVLLLPLLAVLVQALSGAPVDALQAPAGTKAIVFIFTSTDCPISNRYAPEVRRIAEAFGSKGVVFRLVYPNPSEDAKAIRAHMTAYSYAGAFEPLRDPTLALAKFAGATVTPEAVVVANGKIAYRGRIDDRYVDLGRERPAPTQRDLFDALTAIAAGQTARRTRRRRRWVASSRTSRGEERKTAGARGDRRDKDSFSAISAISGFLLCRSCVTSGRSIDHLHEGRRAAVERSLRHVPSRRRLGAVQPADLCRCEAACGADRQGHRRSLHAAVEGGSIRRSISRPASAERRRNRDAAALGGRRRAEGESVGSRQSQSASPQSQWTEGWQLGKPDLIITLPQPYTLQAEGTDAFHIFVLPIPVDRVRFVRGLEFRPGNARVVHHANIRIDTTPASRRLDDADPGPGYDGLIPRSATYPDGHFLGWTPGQVAPLLPDDLAWRLEKNTDLVVELHMQPSGKPEQVSPSIGLYFGDKAPTRTPAMLRLGRQDIDIPAGDAHYVVTDSYTLPVDVELEAVQPHAHYRARDVRGEATLPDGSKKPLIDIADWDFRWQHVFRFVTPLRLPKGTKVSMRYTYDNSPANARNPQQPPVRARWGQRSAEEMGDLWLQVMPRDGADLDRLSRDFRPKVAAEDVKGYESEIEKHPDDAGLHDDVALLYLELGKSDKAIAHFTTVAVAQAAVGGGALQPRHRA